MRGIEKIFRAVPRVPQVRGVEISIQTWEMAEREQPLSLGPRLFLVVLRGEVAGRGPIHIFVNAELIGRVAFGKRGGPTLLADA